MEETKWDQWRTEQARICKVPQVLQEAEPRAYKPRIVSLGSNEFVEMMLLDGCFVIEIIISWVKGVSEVNVGQNTIKNTIRSLFAVAQDMLLLENQLPFFLLDCLYDIAFPGDAGGLTELTQEFLCIFIMFMNDNERVPPPWWH
ncbi:UPF0481 protein [Musa troglodytarum]|uniref:UPF0481 protein n=1 Tax=Musa troglodytarum TaxID=320322 RepID=A0A9E7JVD6_9LILI|nr:UPF0481 protein [Musa troglodytarum]